MDSEMDVNWDVWIERFPEKFASMEEIFKLVHPGDRIFIGTACGEPQALSRGLMDYIQAHPGSFFDAELVQVWNLGITPYQEERFRDNFRLNSFFIGESIRAAVNDAGADYTPIFLSSVPDLIRSEMMPIDLSLIQTSLPDGDGNMSLGISVDIVKAAAEKSRIVAAQANSRMPFVYGDGIVNIRDLDLVVVKDEPLLEYVEEVPGEISQRIGRHISRIVEDGATLQVGYGSVPNATLRHLKDKRHLGLHSELFNDGAFELMSLGVIDNTMKSIDPGRSVASFCMGRTETYDFLNKNQNVMFKSIDYTNNLFVIAGQRNMTAINSALEIDLTGQATAESLGGRFYSGVGGQTDFMRGAALASGGKAILALPSVSNDGRSSRIVPQLSPGAGVTLHRGDVHYVVTEYGIAYLHGKNIRERAMDLIAISHPGFRPWLIEEARRLSLIFKDQVYHPSEYPESLEVWKSTKTGLRIFLRPVKISDEPLLKEFFYSLSDRSLYRRFASARKDMPHSRLQEFVAVDFSRDMVILATLRTEEREIVIGLAQYSSNDADHTAELALVVRDDYQGQGVGQELHLYITYLAKRNGLLGFTAEVLEDNLPAIRLIKKMGFEIAGSEGGVLQMKLVFNQGQPAAGTQQQTR
ncbi:MAG TPA: GNAT family N-acetyltransferase [Methanotrichaceae archaeon]|nr:GNAT family N-acetyltransferase [Methanotrichaceae archaeon]HQF17689.1 GNAT family N-acetyltransferase [Methanotrichaceae archaeon]HQI92275.1 GNAT family N-acetyltransferase [Methanotrichaceae archaeon]HQJ29395.1 GNAT family N-acetyltransferase [Methanotrichaceae archaeon]